MAGCDDGYATDLNSTGETRIVVAWAGALCSLAILVGLGLWGYELVMRDVSGVPVVRRMEGPMRVAPENPGGSQVVHQGLAVNQVTAEGAAAPPADRLRLAPRPVALADEDAPVTAASRPVLRNVDATQAVAEANESPPPAITAPALVDASFAQVPANDAPVAPGTTEQAQSEIAPETAEPPAAPAELTGLQKSLRPRPRPSGDLAAQVALASVTLSSAPLTSNEVAASAVLPGTNLVQLGAYDSPDVARQEAGLMLAPCFP